MPAVVVPVDSAVSVPTLVLMCRPDAPMASSALSIRFVAVTFLVLPAALTISPVSATTLTLVAVTLPKVTLVAAFRRALLPVALTSASPAIVSAAPSASMLIVPVVPVLTSTSVALTLPNKMLEAAFNVMCPVVLTMSELTTRSPVFTSIRMLPAPLALTAVPAAPAVPPLAVPSLKVTVPPATSTTLPLVPVTKSDWVVLGVESPALPLTREMLTVTVLTLTASVSDKYIPPLPALAVSVVTVVSR